MEVSGIAMIGESECLIRFADGGDLIAALSGFSEIESVYRADGSEDLPIESTRELAAYRAVAIARANHAKIERRAVQALIAECSRSIDALELTRTDCGMHPKLASEIDSVKAELRAAYLDVSVLVNPDEFDEQTIESVTERFQTCGAWTDGCKHGESAFVGTVEVNGTAHDVYMYPSELGEQVCIRYGDHGREYLSPGNADRFMADSDDDRFPVYSAARALIRESRDSGKGD